MPFERKHLVIFILVTAFHFMFGVFYSIFRICIFFSIFQYSVDRYFWTFCVFIMDIPVCLSCVSRQISCCFCQLLCTFSSSLVSTFLPFLQCFPQAFFFFNFKFYFMISHIEFLLKFLVKFVFDFLEIWFAFLFILALRSI